MDTGDLIVRANALQIDHEQRPLLTPEARRKQQRGQKQGCPSTRDEEQGPSSFRRRRIVRRSRQLDIDPSRPVAVRWNRHRQASGSWFSVNDRHSGRRQRCFSARDPEPLVDESPSPCAGGHRWARSRSAPAFTIAIVVVARSGDVGPGVDRSRGLQRSRTVSAVDCEVESGNLLAEGCGGTGQKPRPPQRQSDARRPPKPTPTTSDARRARLTAQEPRSRVAARASRRPVRLETRSPTAKR